jgi:predicted Zn-dependent protease
MTMSPEREAAIGRQAAKEVEQQIGLVRDPALVQYVEKLGRRIAEKSPRQDVTYRFHVADMEVPNAFALPGGYIYVSRGLLLLTNDEAELAGVIGHEIGHVAAHHAAKQESRSTRVGVLSALGTLAGAVLGGSTGAAVASDISRVAGAGHIASYGRDHEREADELGQKMAADGGYDPAAMTAFLKRLGESIELQTGQKEIPSFLDSHPATFERVRDTAWRAPSLQIADAPPVSSSRAAYLAHLMGVTIGPDPAHGVFVGTRFLQPELGFALDFPPGWRTGNQPLAVGAVAPDGQAMILLEAQGGTTDPAGAANAFARAHRLVLRDGGQTVIGGRLAYHATARSPDSIELDLTWIAHTRGTFRVTGTTSTPAFETYAPIFGRVTRSFHGLTARELARIRTRRLYVVRAESGETLGDLSRRTNNVWSVEETAIINSLSPDRRVPTGTLVKIAVERPYRR